MFDKFLEVKVYYERSANSNPYYATNQELNLLSKFIKELISNDIFKDKLLIDSFKGGNRNPMANECELDFRIKFDDVENEELILDILDELVNKYKAKYNVQREVNNMIAERYKIPLEKMSQLEKILKEKDIDSLLVFSREHSDPSLPFLIGDDAIHIAAAFFNKDGKHRMITSVSDQKKFEESGIFSEVITYNNSIKEKFSEELEKMNIKKLALNISKEDNLCDGLTQGLYIMLEDFIGRERLDDIFVSSEDILQELRSRKTDTEIENIREAIKITQDIYDEVFSKVECGMSEIEIAELFVNGMKKRNVTSGTGEGYAYPIVCLVRAGLAHRNPGPTKSIPGDILIMDFSVRYKGYVSDIARTAYFLKEGETEPPYEVQKAFNTAYNAITKTIEYIGVGKKGYEVDAVGRKVIEDGGYPTIRHSVGHQIGLACHETGTRLAPRRPQSEGEIKEREVYAIEPTVIQDDGLPCMLVEENVVIWEEGAEILSRRQESLYLVAAPKTGV